MLAIAKPTLFAKGEDVGERLVESFLTYEEVHESNSRDVEQDAAAGESVESSRSGRVAPFATARDRPGQLIAVLERVEQRGLTGARGAEHDCRDAFV